MSRLLVVFMGFWLMLGLFFHFQVYSMPEKTVFDEREIDYSYWFVLHRASNIENLYLGVPGNKNLSKLIQTFRVKTGIPNKRPTPLPQLLNREYWFITGKKDMRDDPETAPYFLTLDIPYSDEAPYGPVPYFECEGVGSDTNIQCNWERPGEFGLHGVAGDENRLSPENAGSSGCIRHTDSDITYLYTILDPEKEQIRYYVEDN